MLSEKELDDFTDDFLADDDNQGDDVVKETGNQDPDKSGDDQNIESDGSNIWNGSTEDQRNEVKSLQDRLALAEHAASSDRGRNKALHAKVKKLEEEKLAKVADKPQEAGNENVTTYTDQELSDMKDDLPEVSAIVSQETADLKKQIADIESRFSDNQDVQEVEETVQQTSQAQADRTAEIAKVTQVHPDFVETINSIDYSTWLSRQPSGVQDLASSPMADNAIVVVGMFKDAHKRNLSKTNKELESMVDIPSKGLTKSSMVDEDDFDAQYEHFSKQFET